MNYHIRATVLQESEFVESSIQEASKTVDKLNSPILVFQKSKYDKIDT